MERNELWSQEWADLLQPGLAEDFFAAPMPAFALPATGSVDVRFALWMAECCRLIYRQEGDEDSGRLGAKSRAEFVAAAGPEWREKTFLNGLSTQRVAGWKSWRPALPADDTQAALLTHTAPDCSVLVFRGTLGTRNVLTDLAFLASPSTADGATAVHTGFAAALNTIWEDVQTALRDTVGPLYLTGHSLGGALATLAALRLVQEPEFQDRVAGLYTFGCPRVATGGFAENPSGLSHARIVHGDDLVTKLPPAFSLPFFPVYQHLGLLVKIDSEGDCHVIRDQPSGPDIRAGMVETADLLRKLLALPNLEQFGAPAKPLKDHTPLLYTRALRRAVEQGKAVL